MLNTIANILTYTWLASIITAFIYGLIKTNKTTVPGKVRGAIYLALHVGAGAGIPILITWTIVIILYT